MRRSFLLIVLATVIPVLPFSTWIVRRTAQQERAAVETKVIDTAGLVAERVEAGFEAQFSALTALADSGALDEDDLVVFYRQAQRVKLFRPLWYTVELVSPSG